MLLTASIIRARSQIGYFTWDILEDRIWVDAKLAEILALSKEEVEAGFQIMRFMEIVHPDDRQEVARITHDAVVSGDPFSLVYRINRDGETVWLRGQGRCFRYIDGYTTMSSGQIEEIDPKTAEAAAANHNQPVLSPAPPNHP